MPDVQPDEGAPEGSLTGIPAQITVRILVGNQLIADLITERPSEIEARIFCEELAPQIEALLMRGHYAH